MTFCIQNRSSVGQVQVQGTLHYAVVSVFPTSLALLVSRLVVSDSSFAKVGQRSKPRNQLELYFSGIMNLCKWDDRARWLYSFPVPNR